MSLLEVRGVSKFFGGLAALNSVSFSVNKGEIFGLNRSKWCREDHTFQCGERFLQTLKRRSYF